MTDQTHDAFTTEVGRLYRLERELATDLDDLARDVSIDALDDLQETECRERLRDRVETHRDETESHADRLEEAFDAIGEEPAARDVPGLDGWVADKERFNNVVLNDELRPLYYLVATQKLEEIERSAYEPALALAERLESEDDVTGIVDPLEQNAEEERAMLADLESMADGESFESLLETSPVAPTDRSALDRSGLNVETLEDLFLYQLRDVYCAELTLADLFEEMATEVDSGDLGEAFADHADRTRAHVDRLEGVFEEIGPRPTECPNRTFDGLIESRRERLESADGEATDRFALELALTGGRIEGRCYEALLTLADRIGYSDEVVDQLTANLDEGRERVDALEGIGFEGLIETSEAAD